MGRIARTPRAFEANEVPPTRMPPRPVRDATVAGMTAADWSPEDVRNVKETREERGLASRRLSVPPPSVAAPENRPRSAQTEEIIRNILHFVILTAADCRRFAGIVIKSGFEASR